MPSVYFTVMLTTAMACRLVGKSADDDSHHSQTERRPALAGKKKIKKDTSKATAGDSIPVSPGDVGGVGNVDKIRDILFGAQMRDYEKKFARLEDRILKEVSRMREETTKRFDALELYINKEVESLGLGLKDEQADRAESIKEMQQEVQKASKALEKKITKLEEQTGKSARDLRQQILDQSKSLTEDIRKRYEETSAALEQTASEPRDEKADRSTLAELLTEMALRLSHGSDMGLGFDPDSIDTE